MCGICGFTGSKNNAVLKKMTDLLYHRGPDESGFFSVSTRVVLSRDAKDDHYLSLCKEVEADYLVTGDKDLLSIPPEALKENGIPCRILTPQEFVERV